MASDEKKPVDIWCDIGDDMVDALAKAQGQLDIIQRECDGDGDELLANDYGGTGWELEPPVTTVREMRIRVWKNAHLKGAQWMLDEIRSSLRGYPNSGGDIEVMKEVKRLLAEAYAESQRQVAAAYQAAAELIEERLTNPNNSYPSMYEHFLRQTMKDIVSLTPASAAAVQQAREDALIEATKEACAAIADEEREDWCANSSGSIASGLIGKRICALTPASIRQWVKEQGK